MKNIGETSKATDIDWEEDEDNTQLWEHEAEVAEAMNDARKENEGLELVDLLRKRLEHENIQVRQEAANEILDRVGYFGWKGGN